MKIITGFTHIKEREGLGRGTMTGTSHNKGGGGLSSRQWRGKNEKTSKKSYFLGLKGNYF